MVLSLKINIIQSGVIKTVQFDEACLIYDACKNIREKIPDAKQGQGELYYFIDYLSLLRIRLQPLQVLTTVKKLAVAAVKRNGVAKEPQRNWQQVRQALRNG